jgi:hypothetical protein
MPEPWIIRCANPRCRHVCSETDWVFKPTDRKLVKQSHCPKCDCKSYSKAKPEEIERMKAGQTVPPRKTPDWQFGGEWPCVDLTIPIGLEGGAGRTSHTILPGDAIRLLEELSSIIPVEARTDAKWKAVVRPETDPFQSFR